MCGKVATSSSLSFLPFFFLVLVAFLILDKIVGELDVNSAQWGEIELC